MVIARFGYDNFIVATAIKNNVSVVDAIQTLLAVHQTDMEGNFAGKYKTRRKLTNFMIVSKCNKNGSRIYLHRGFTTAAQYKTINVVNKSDDTVTVRVVKRKH